MTDSEPNPTRKHDIFSGMKPSQVRELLGFRQDPITINGHTIALDSDIETSEEEIAILQQEIPTLLEDAAKEFPNLMPKFLMARRNRLV